MYKGIVAISIKNHNKIITKTLHKEFREKKLNKKKSPTCASHSHSSELNSLKMKRKKIGIHHLRNHQQNKKNWRHTFAWGFPLTPWRRTVAKVFFLADKAKKL